MLKAFLKSESVCKIRILKATVNVFGEITRSNLSENDPEKFEKVDFSGSESPSPHISLRNWKERVRTSPSMENHFLL